LLFWFVKGGKRLVDFGEFWIVGMFTMEFMVLKVRFGEVFIGSSDFKFGLEVDFIGGGFGFVEGLGGSG
jgi:hypothetical protein